MTKFSIVIPLYNKASCIKKTLDSILKQRYSNFEIIVVNDGSTDNSLQEVLSVIDARIKIISKPNGGVSSARNRGIEEAAGEWIAFFDADDTMYPNALEEYNYLIEHFPEAKVVTTSFDQSNKKYNSSPNRYLITDYDLAETISTAKSGFSVTCSDCICVHRACFEQVGLFNENYTHGEDLDMWLRLSKITHFAKSEITTALYVIGAENSSLKNIKTGRFAPIAKVDRHRGSFITKSEKLRHGCKAFHFIFPSGFRSQPKQAIKLFFKYGDWILGYACVFIKFRFLHKQR